MSEDRSITQYFGDNLAELLAEKIRLVYKDFDGKTYIENIREKRNLSLLGKIYNITLM